MTIVQDRPPIWDEAHKHFDIDDSRTFYTYGEKIYNPSGVHIADHIIEHESVHMWQQRDYGPATWWKRYFTEQEFRREQELEAYGHQYWFYCKNQKDRNMQAKFLHGMVGVIVSPMYKLELTREEAQEGVLKWADKKNG